MKPAKLIGMVASITLVMAWPAVARSIDIGQTSVPQYADTYDSFDDFSQASPPITVLPVVVPPATTPPLTTPPAETSPPATEPPVEDLTESGRNGHLHDEDEGTDDLSIGEVPLIETMELTDAVARKALEAFVLVREKYKDAELENYETLQEFVDQNTLGKAFETDIKTYGFANVNDWNLAISTLGFAYNNSLDDQTEDVKQQIEEVKADPELAQDMKDRMISSLSAMLPTPNNAAVVDALLKDPVIAEQLKLLESEGE